jgi:hypothetical protein
LRKKARTKIKLSKSKAQVISTPIAIIVMSS